MKEKMKKTAIIFLIKLVLLNGLILLIFPKDVKKEPQNLKQGYSNEVLVRNVWVTGAGHTTVAVSPAFNNIIADAFSISLDDFKIVFKNGII